METKLLSHLMSWTILKRSQLLEILLSKSIGLLLKPLQEPTSKLVVVGMDRAEIRIKQPLDLTKRLFMMLQTMISKVVTSSTKNNHLIVRKAPKSKRRLSICKKSGKAHTFQTKSKLLPIFKIKSPSNTLITTQKLKIVLRKRRALVSRIATMILMMVCPMISVKVLMRICSVWSPIYLYFQRM